MGKARLLIPMVFLCLNYCLAFAQSESSGLKEFRYDIAYKDETFRDCEKLILAIEEMKGVQTCECISESNRITIYTKEKENVQIANLDDFKWVFLEHNLNIIKQKRTILSVGGEPVSNDVVKDSPTRQGGSDAPQQQKSIKIQGKKDYPKN